MKKWRAAYLALLIVAALVVGMFAGCAAEKEQPTADSAPEETVQETVESEEPAEPEIDEAEARETNEPEAAESVYPLVEEPVTLSLWTSFPPPMADAMEGDVSRMYAYQVAAEVTNVNLEIETVTNDTASEQFNLRSAANDWTDMIYGVSGYTNSLEQAVEDEIIIELNQLLESCAPDYSALLAQEPDLKKEATLDSGVMAAIYGMEDVSTIVAGPQIRKDLLDAVGMDMPRTMDQLEQVLLAFKNELGVKYPIYSSAMDSGLFSAVITSAYGVSGFYVDQNDEIVCGWLNDEYRDMVQLMKSWYDQGIITGDTLTITGVENAIQGGLTAVWCDNIKTMSASAEAAVSEDCDIAPMYYVTVEEGGTAYVNARELAVDPVSVSGCCETPELAVGLLNFFFTDEGIMACNYGIENDSFVYNENGQPQFTDFVTNNPNGLDITVAKAIYSSFAVPSVHMPIRTTDTYTLEDELNASDIWKENVDNSRTYHGDMNVDEASEYSSIMADIETFVDESVPKFITGETSIDQWESFTAQVVAMGIERAIELKQAAYDRYLMR